MRYKQVGGMIDAPVEIGILPSGDRPSRPVLVIRHGPECVMLPVEALEEVKPMIDLCWQRYMAYIGRRE